jgi:hypothetical protein
LGMPFSGRCVRAHRLRSNVARRRTEAVNYPAQSFVDYSHSLPYVLSSLRMVREVRAGYCLNRIANSVVHLGDHFKPPEQLRLTCTLRQQPLVYEHERQNGGDCRADEPYWPGLVHPVVVDQPLKRNGCHSNKGGSCSRKVTIRRTDLGYIESRLFPDISATPY